MYKKLFLFSLLLVSSSVFSQMKVGANPKIIKNYNFFEVESQSGKRFVISKDSAKVGIGVDSASHRLYVLDSVLDPIKVIGLKSGNTSDSILVITSNGLIRRINTNSIKKEPWLEVSTNLEATSNTQNIYQMGRVGIGKNNPANNLVVRGLNRQPSVMGVDQSDAIFRVEGQTNHSLDFGTLNDAPYGSYIQSFNKTATSGLPLSLNPTGGSVGIGTVAPSNTLHVVSSSNPLRIEGLQNGAASDSLLSVNSTGVVRKLAVSSIASGGGSWHNVATNTAASSNTQDIYQMGKVGIGTTTPSSSAVLDLVATDKALLLPRVANTAAIASPVNGMLIYDNASNCIKGYENGAWTNCYSSGGSSASVVQDCNANGLEGNYFNGQALSGTRYPVRITNNSFSSATIAFAASDLALTGVLGMTVGTPTGSPALTSGSITLVAGQSVVVTYPITGTPTSQGTLTARWTKLALTCTRTIAVVNAPPTFNCNGAIITTNRSNLIKDSTYSGTISIPYTVAGGGEAFPAETITSNGLSFTRNAGTYTAPSGSISYTFSGTYTGTTNAVFTINTDNNAGACAIVIFDAIRGALAQGGCTSCAAYDAAAANAWISITATEYARVALINGAGKYVASDAFMSGTPSNSYTGAASATQAIPLQSKVPANEFIVAFSMKNGPSGSTNSSMSGIKLKISGTSQSSGYSDVGAAVTGPTGLGAAVQSYWVRKRPTTTVGTASVWVGYSQIASGQVGISTSSSTNFSAANDVNTITGSQNFAPFVQVLSTPTKQW